MADVRDGVVALRASRKLVYLVGGSVATELLFAVALGACVQAFGYDFAFADILLINISVSLFASLIPVPGGIGITEGALIVGLTGLGMTDEAAFAAAITYRLSTFYLPPISGRFAMSGCAGIGCSDGRSGCCDPEPPTVPTGATV